MTDSDIIPNISCEQAQEDSLALLGGELTDQQERRLLSHLAACASCREQTRRDRMIWHMLGSCPAPTAAAGFTDAVMQRIAAEEPPARQGATRHGSESPRPPAAPPRSKPGETPYQQPRHKPT